VNTRYSLRSKFSAWALVEDHYDTLRNYQTGRRRLADYVTYLGLPGAIAVAGWLLHGRARNIPDVLAAIAILTGLIFGVFVLVFDLTARAADALSDEDRGLALRLADELRANVSYARAARSGLEHAALLGGIAMFADTSKPLSRTVSAVITFFGLHLLLTIFMILKRTRAMFGALVRGGPERLP
jgi:hypothetical protein